MHLISHFFFLLGCSSRRLLAFHVLALVPLDALHLLRQCGVAVPTVYALLPHLREVLTSSVGNSSRRECANPHPAWLQDGPYLHSPHRHILSKECGHSADLFPFDCVEATDSGTADLCEPGRATACLRTGVADAAAPGPCLDRSVYTSVDQCVYSSTQYTGSKASSTMRTGRLTEASCCWDPLLVLSEHTTETSTRHDAWTLAVAETVAVLENRKTRQRKNDR